MGCRNCVNGACTKRCVVYGEGSSDLYSTGVGSMYQTDSMYGGRN